MITRPLSVSEVQKAVLRGRGLCERWAELLQEEEPVSQDELEWSKNELRNCLRAIEWDLEDLQETISILQRESENCREGTDRQIDHRLGSTEEHQYSTERDRKDRQ